jgi:hypothetical protein
MSDHSVQGPEPIPHEAWYFIFALVAVLGILIAGWIIKMT